jgi:hypothetical protein
MFDISTGKYKLSLVSEGLPDLYNDYIKRAVLVEEFDIRNSEGENCFLSVGYGTEWPFLVVSQRYSPAGYGFNPGALIVHETDILFIGAGERLLAYNLKAPERLWEDAADTGFWGWTKHENFVLMSAELEFAAWDSCGKKLCSTFVEPPWEYEIDKDIVELDVMGEKQVFKIENGPKST